MVNTVPVGLQVFGGAAVLFGDGVAASDSNFFNRKSKYIAIFEPMAGRPAGGCGTSVAKVRLSSSSSGFGLQVYYVGMYSTYNTITYVTQ